MDFSPPAPRIPSPTHHPPALPGLSFSPQHRVPYTIDHNEDTECEPVTSQELQDDFNTALKPLLDSPDIRFTEDSNHIWIRLGDTLYDFVHINHPHLAKARFRVEGRRIKSEWVQIKRNKGVVAHSQWSRNNEPATTIRFDDLYELTDLGKEKLKEFQEKLRSKKRRAKVFPYPWIVKMSMVCMGSGNCKRMCGAFGGCVDGCPFTPPKNKCHRHFCSMRVKIMVFLDNLHWARLEVEGGHVPPDSGVGWVPIDPCHLPLHPREKDTALAARRCYGASAQQILDSNPDLIPGYRENETDKRAAAVALSRIRQLLRHDDQVRGERKRDILISSPEKGTGSNFKRLKR